jgi:hypothetical protein
MKSGNKIKAALGKRGVIERQALLVLILIVIVFVVLLFFAQEFSTWVDTLGVTNKCRVTMSANAFVRFREGKTLDELMGGQDMHKERIPVECPRLQDLEIKHSAVKSLSGSKEAMKFNIMKMIAEEMRTCHYRYLGDMPNVLPFGAKEGRFCGICREFYFDDAIKKDFNLNSKKDSEKLSNLMTFLMNAKMSNPNVYYSEYLYGFKKTTSNRFTFQDLVDSKGGQVGESIPSEYKLNALDLTIDPSKNYYVVHIIWKSKNPMDRVIREELDKKASRVTTAISTAVDSLLSGRLLSFVGDATDAYASTFNWVDGKLCGDNKDKKCTQHFIRTTTIVPAEEVYTLCDADKTYGMERYDPAKT